MKFDLFFPSPRLKAISHLLRRPVLLTFFMLIAVFGCQQFTGQKTAHAPSSGTELFKSKCGKCHDPELAMKQYRSAGVWFDTIARMKDEHNADISREEIDQLVKYHVERQQQEAAVFKEKCQKCHPGKVFLDQKLTDDQARAIIKSMQQKAGNSIEDKDIDIIVRYHAQAQQAALEANLTGIYNEIVGNQPGMKRGMTLFVEKCSSCHQSTRALTVIKDPKIWEQTIKRMQFYSRGAITDLEAKELVNFHVSEQQREVSTFQETCTKCHDDKRIISRSLSEEQWLETIKRMQQKAPELITDEKVSLLSAYFHRRELALARIFYDKCHLCHTKSSAQAPGQAGSTAQMNGLITLANAEFGQSLEINDINNLLTTHTERQKRTMQLYETGCTTCHPDGIPKKKEPGKEDPNERTRAEWISFIATLEGIELNKESQNTIDSQIDYHVSRH